MPPGRVATSEIERETERQREQDYCGLMQQRSTLDVRGIRRGSGQRPGGEHYIMSSSTTAPPTSNGSPSSNTPTFFYIYIHTYKSNETMLILKCLHSLTARPHKGAVIYSTKKPRKFVTYPLSILAHFGFPLYPICGVPLTDVCLVIRPVNSFTFVNWYYKPSCPICPSI